MNPTLGDGKICYIEIPASDIRRSAEFYEKVFGWRIERSAARCHRVTPMAPFVNIARRSARSTQLFGAATSNERRVPACKRSRWARARSNSGRTIRRGSGRHRNWRGLFGKGRMDSAAEGEKSVLHGKSGLRRIGGQGNATKRVSLSLASLIPDFRPLTSAHDSPRRAQDLQQKRGQFHLALCSM